MKSSIQCELQKKSLCVNLSCQKYFKKLSIYLFISCYFRYANDVSVGDELLVQGNEKLIPTKVVDITDLIMQGNYSHYFYNFEFVGKY